ncbi:transketolase [Chrysiogenes arsenatis]|uniref:transketolase n=1 Tax=Chrysiogenes arsenatis TaxID=309797 RepID=UPI000417165A|nr:transketolase [Chrysiogenes arsenatis]
MNSIAQDCVSAALNTDESLVAILKGLIMDGVRQANSGHTGGAFSSADFAYTLFKKHLRFDPDDAAWWGRDRFILSAGHESMLLYSLLTMVGYLDTSELARFRQLGSKTPGHPEFGYTPGVEATTGPLGQGIAMGVGMALGTRIAQAHLGKGIIDNATYVLVGDGDLQEPVALGSAQLAGHYGLDSLIVYYDCNKIQISGKISRNDSTDIPAMFRAFQWNVVEVDGHNRQQIDAALTLARHGNGKPTIIIGHTTMAHGCATMEGDKETHGSPLPHAEIAATKVKLGLPEEPFYLPESALADFRSHYPALRQSRQQWNKSVAQARQSSALAPLVAEFIDGVLPAVQYPDLNSKMATRKAFGMALEAAGKACTALVGGSADLEPSNNTTGFMKHVGDYTKQNPAGRSLPFGVREFPMGAITNGLQLFGIKSFGATFLTFSDYERGAIRLAALQNIGTMFIFTHDSIYLGEDGPTHQPVEHIPSLRLIPNLLVIRPADAPETGAAFDFALRTKRPTLLSLTRQDLPVVTQNYYQQGGSIERGGYVLRQENGTLGLVIIATGSEIELALSVAQTIEAEAHVGVRVVNIPCVELFEEQSQHYRDEVIPTAVRNRVSLEAATTAGWYKYVGLDGLAIGIDTFGESGPAEQLAEHFGFTATHVRAKIQTKFGI